MARTWCGCWINHRSLWWTFRCYICSWKLSELSGQQKWWAGWQQRADSRLRHQRPPQKPVLPVSILLWRMLPFSPEPFFAVWFSFSFPSSLYLPSYCHQLLILYLKKATALNLWFVPIQASACSQVYFHPLFSILVLHAPLFLPAFFIQKLASCFASFNKHWELSTAAWGSLPSCGSLPFSWLA